MAEAFSVDLDVTKLVPRIVDADLCGAQIMTLVGLGLFNEFPVFFGDLLLTQLGSPKEEANIPALNNINAFLGADVDHHVVGMTQKLNIISDRFAICWAGSRWQAHTMIRELAELEAHEGTLSADRVMAHIDSVPEADRNELSLIGAITRPSDGHTAVQCFAHDVSDYENGGCRLIVAGSGEEDFLDRMGGWLERNPMPPSPARNPNIEFINWIEGLSLSTAGWVMGRDVWTTLNARKAWGGAFEVAVIRGDRFQKTLGDTLFLFWEVSHRDSTELIVEMTPLFLKFDYIDDLLVVQKLEFEAVGRELLFREHSFFCFTPILKKPSDYRYLIDVKMPELTHRNLVSFAILPDNQSNLTFCYGNADGDGVFKISRDGRYVSMSFKDTLLDAIERKIEAATGLKAKTFLRAVAR